MDKELQEIIEAIKSPVVVTGFDNEAKGTSVNVIDPQKLASYLLSERKSVDEELTNLTNIAEAHTALLEKLLKDE